MAKKAVQKPMGSTRSLWSRIWEHRFLYVMLLPMVVLLLIFNYYPMYGVILAFKDFNFSAGILGSPWTKNHGFYNFLRLFRDPSFSNAMINTLSISLGRLIFDFPNPIMMALLIN